MRYVTMVSQEASQPPAAYYTGSPKYVEDDSQKARHNEEKGGSSIDTSDAESGHQLKRELKGRHMQMIAVGGAIGAGLFVGSGSALQAGGPASLVLGFIIIGFMLLLTMQALAELAVLFPVNGAFFTYAVRFIDPSWGFAIGWDYAIGWLVILPFEITAASLTIAFWDSAKDINIGVWITVFLVALIIKILACTGFIILGIIINCGGVPTDDRGYIGARYWHDPGAFRHGFKGFCSVFVTAAFAFGGTELSGLAAAEAKNPLKSIPQATKQVFWRIAFFYVVSLFILGLIVPSDSDVLLNSHGANTKASPFVYAMVLAGIKGLPSVFNVVICLSVLSVANSSAFGSTRTIQALAAHGMAPKALAYIDKRGRPVWCVFIQLSFGLLAFVNEATDGGPQFFNWLLALTGLANFFIWATICFSHIRFRAGWKAQGRSIDEIPYKAFFGIWGSYIGIAMNILCLIACFYVALWPIGGSPNAEDFFESYLAAPLILSMYICWKVYRKDWKLFIRAAEMDVTTGMRHNLAELREMAEERQRSLGLASWPKRVVRALF
ncbi:putative amino-acid permease P7G5.06 [Pseudocercospora fuligena]|uniref:Putative amino-acid permease P7G5.06 n=1 Tax=Pseudocercospora fuligena TaxID=685502 RepID=A0A8H6VLA6_9PEZI|nr:putative amino-acid permease P7G5.06 [Pseudocercospora fuligena]